MRGWSMCGWSMRARNMRARSMRERCDRERRQRTWAERLWAERAWTEHAWAHVVRNGRCCAWTLAPPLARTPAVLAHARGWQRTHVHKDPVQRIPVELMP